MKSTRRSWLTLLGLPAMLLTLTMWQSGCGNGDPAGDAGDVDTPAAADPDHDHEEGDHDHNGDHTE